MPGCQGGIPWQVLSHTPITSKFPYDFNREIVGDYVKK